ncbi:MAG: peptidoglycan DD-metalloendopeptidase family protein [Proteobacteria bacterium]|nr:peptidoglycan DD-metalloendopeptidase family protein [Pseudomonadota bacterium]
MRRTAITIGILAIAAFIPFWMFDLEPKAATTPDQSMTAPQPGEPRHAILGIPNADPKVLASIPVSSAPLAPIPVESVHEVGRGDTLIEILVDSGVNRSDAHKAVSALGKYYRPRDMRPGQEIALLFDLPESIPSRRFTRLTIWPRIDREVTVTRKGEVFETTEFDKPLKHVVTRAVGIIKSSLYESAVKAGVPVPVLMEAVRIYSWDVDFQRQIQNGDLFDLVYERVLTEDGAFVRHGRILHGNMTLSGEANHLYLHTMSDGTVDYFDQKGQSARKALMKTPINGARLSSGYGKRRHPVLGYTKMHQGVDFAAPRGTPIYAAGSGTVKVRGRNGGYGNYIRISHNAEYSTAYAHMKSFARKVTRGSRVKQGQIIGYVGSTGRSTGPHLHYEILRNGRRMNPMSIRMPSGQKLKGKELALFKKTRTKTDELIATLPVPSKVAANNPQ